MNDMTGLLTYRATEPTNLYRLCSMGGHTIEDLETAFNVIFSAPPKELGLLLDIQNGLSLFPKEQGAVFARQASQLGIQRAFIGIIAPAEDISDLNFRYVLYPELVKQYLDLDIKIFADEVSATQWVIDGLNGNHSENAATIATEIPPLP